MAQRQGALPGFYSGTLSDDFPRTSDLTPEVTGPAATSTTTTQPSPSVDRRSAAAGAEVELHHDHLPAVMVPKR